MNAKAGPIVTGIQFIVLALFWCFTFFFTDGVKLCSQKPIIVSASKLETDVSTALAGKSEAEKIKAYKVVKGIAEYCRNSERTLKNKKVRDMIVEVGNTYKLEDFTDFNKVVENKSIEAGLKPDVDLSISKADLAKVYDEIADAVKLTLQKDK